jgi:hypothetical protein
MTSARTVMRERPDYSWVELDLLFFESFFYSCKVRRKNLGFFNFLWRTYNTPQSVGLLWESNRSSDNTQQSQQTSKPQAGIEPATPASERGRSGGGAGAGAVESSIPSRWTSIRTHDNAYCSTLHVHFCIVKHEEFWPVLENFQIVPHKFHPVRALIGFPTRPPHEVSIFHERQGTALIHLLENHMC